MKTTARQLVILTLVALVIGQVWQVIPSYEMIIAQKKSMPSLFEVHKLLFLPMILSGIISVNVIGYIDYYFGTKRGLLIALILATAGVFFVAIADGGYVYYFMAQVCVGASVACTMSALSGLSMFASGELSSTMLLVVFAALVLGSTFVPSLMDYFNKHHTWQEIPLYLGFLTILLYMIVQLFVDDIRSKDHPSPKSHLLTLWRKVPLRVLLFIGLILANTLSQTLLQQLGGTYLAEIKKEDSHTILLLMTTFLFSMGFGALLAALIDACAPTKYLYPGLAAFVLIGYTVLPFAGEVYQSFLATVLIGMGTWSLLPLTIFFIHKQFPEIEEIATSLIISTYFIGMGICRFLNNIHHEALRETFHLGLLTAAITLGLSLYLGMKHAQSARG